MRDASFLTELYWYTCVVDLGSYSAAAEQAGVAKSSLSRRIVQLEERLGVQLLSRNTRKLCMTSAGEDIYRHALDMLAAAHSAQVSAEEILGKPSGLVRVAIPGILSECMLGVLKRFQHDNPGLRYELCLDDDINTAFRHFDLCLSLHPPPTDSAEIVVRPVVSIPQVIVANPSFAERSGQPMHLEQLADNQLLAQGTSLNPKPWILANGARTLTNPALISQNLKLLKDAAIAGTGAAYLPFQACKQELERQSLQIICAAEQTVPLQLHSLTPAFRGITLTTRKLMETIHDALQQPY